MRILLVGCLALLLGCGGGGGGGGVSAGWTADFDAAMKTAAGSSKPMLVYFTGKDW